MRSSSKDVRGFVLLPEAKENYLCGSRSQLLYERNQRTRKVRNGSGMKIHVTTCSNLFNPVLAFSLT